MSRRREKGTSVAIEALAADLLGLEETETSEDNYINELFDKADLLTFRVSLNEVRLHRMTPSTVSPSESEGTAREGPAGESQLRASGPASVALGS